MEPSRLWDELGDVDERIIELLSKRAEVARKLGEALDGDQAALEGGHYKADLPQTWRDSAVLSAGQLSGIFAEIHATCDPLLRPQPPRVTCLGKTGSFTHLAASRWFGTQAVYDLQTPIHLVFDQLVHGNADFGVVAVENSIGGTVGENLDLLAEHVGERFSNWRDAKLTICGSLTSRIEHCLLGSGPLDGIRTVCSHPQGLEQCRHNIRRFLDYHQLRDVLLVTASSTSDAAARAADDPSVVAIANRLAAQLFDLDILRDHMEDNPKNTTRFYVLGRHIAAQGKANRTLLRFRSAHESGILGNVIRPLAEAGLNMTMLVSRPIPDEPWTYSFFLEFEGHAGDPEVHQALVQLQHRCMPQCIEVIGSYPFDAPMPSKR